MKTFKVIALWLGLLSSLQALDYIYVEKVTSVQEGTWYSYPTIDVYYDSGKLYEDGSFDVEDSLSYEWTIFNDSDQATFNTVRSFGQWAKGKYVHAYTEPTASFITVTGSHADPYGNGHTYYSVSIKGSGDDSDGDDPEDPESPDDELSYDDALDLLQQLAEADSYESFLSELASESLTEALLRSAFRVAAGLTDDPVTQGRIKELEDLMVKLHDFATAKIEGKDSLLATAIDIDKKVGAYQEIVNGMAGWMNSVLDDAFGEAMTELQQPISSALGGASYTARGSYYGGSYTPYNTVYGYSSNFGNTVESLYPYAYLSDYNAWLYIAGGPLGSSLYVYSPVTGTFIPTSGDLFPYGYSITHGSWVYFYPGSTVNAIAIYDAARGSWIYSDSTTAPYAWHYGLGQWITL